MDNVEITNLEKAKKYLFEEHYTLVLCKDNKILSSRDRGVSSLLNFCDLNLPLDGYSAADKVVGNGAAFLYAHLKIKEVYAKIISKDALNTLKKYNINVEYDTLVDKIKDKTGKGFCPIETAVRNAKDINDAIDKIKNKLEELKK